MIFSKLKNKFTAIAAAGCLITSTIAVSQCQAKTVESEKNKTPRPVIWVGDFNNFDDAVALILVAKDPRYKVELVVVEDSFNTVAHGANTVYNILEWMGNTDAEVIRGAYHAVEEIQYGANGLLATNAQVQDEHAVDGKPDFQQPNSSDFKSGQWNLERRNTMGINLYGQYVPGPWRDNGSTLYGTDHLIPRAKTEGYRYTGNRGMSFEFQLAEDIILEKIDQLKKKPVILNTGKLTTMARVLAKASDAQINKIKSVIMMGGGFENFEPFTANHEAACFGDKSRNLGGNIFSHPSFGCESDFSTHQEFNILLDPLSAQWAFDLLSKRKVKSYLVPTNSTDMAKVQLSSIKDLSEKGTTPEACYTAKLFESIREFEGGDFNGNGDFALDAVIRLWDIIAAHVLLDEDKIEMDIVKSYIKVDQLNPGLAKSDTPYDPITFDPMVGKTMLSKHGEGKKIKIVMGINTDAARQAMIERLRDAKNSAKSGPQCGLASK